METIRIPNLERFQHYKDRKPPWVKLHRDFWTDYDLSGESASTRLLALFLISYASEFQNARIPLNFRELSRRSSLSKRTVQNGVNRLLSIGFIENGASALLAPRYQNAIPSTEKEVEEELEAGVELGEKDLAVQKLLDRLKDKDDLTVQLIESSARALPPAAFYAALEAVDARRGKKPELVSEARYAVSVLNSWAKEGRYGA